MCEHLHTGKNSNIYGNLKGSDKCRKSTDTCITVLDVARSDSHYKTEDALDILWEWPALHSQVKLPQNVQSQLLNLNLAESITFKQLSSQQS